MRHPRKYFFWKTSFSAISRGYQVEGKKKISEIRSEKRNFGLFQYIAMNIENEAEIRLPVSEKYLLSIREAAAYFGIGIKKMRRLAEDNLGRYAVYSGNRYLINRTKFEEFIEKSSEI